MIKRVYDALAPFKEFERTVAVISPGTPETERFLKSSGIEIAKSRGAGYSIDLSEFLANCDSQAAFMVPGDLALLDAGTVGRIRGFIGPAPFSEGQHRVVSVLCELDFVKQLGFVPSVEVAFNGRDYCHSGISLFDCRRRNQKEMMQEKYVVLNEVGAAANVNTRQELLLAEKLALVQRA